MSIISTFEADNSVALARRFAALTASYLDDPSAAQRNIAKIPLENLFRLLEMFRYQAFADEPRRGVLAMEGVSEESVVLSSSESNWYSEIDAALRTALASTFNSMSQNEAIDELQDDLRGLASQGVVADAARAGRVKNFLNQFQAQLA